jgi:hypothetical protein
MLPRFTRLSVEPGRYAVASDHQDLLVIRAKGNALYLAPVRRKSFLYNAATLEIDDADITTKSRSHQRNTGGHVAAGGAPGDMGPQGRERRGTGLLRREANKPGVTH